GQHQLHLLAGSDACELTSESAACAGDDSDLAGQIIHGRLLAPCLARRSTAGGRAISLCGTAFGGRLRTKGNVKKHVRCRMCGRGIFRHNPTAEEEFMGSISKHRTRAGWFASVIAMLATAASAQTDQTGTPTGPQTEKPQAPET